MKTFASRTLPFSLVLTLWLSAAGPAAAQSYKAEPLNEAPPSDLAASVQRALSPTGIRVSGPGGALCDIWLGKAVAGKANAPQSLGVVFPQFAQGTLVGAIRFPNSVKDYRKQSIKAGVYTLRYALVPENGNHMGVAPQRDFVLASPAALDQDPSTLTIDQTLTLSRKATGSNHPSVWSLAPPEDHPKSLPSVFHLDDGDLWLVEFQLPLHGAITLSMALVVVGAAPEA
ncbi:MAG TPA: hypothetical protein VHM93_25795 [Candidatus Acidoferrum sp.]|jgi:hypothetical protein|nr:hypothetical protein [Candidatus Acidoferrum sp.]